jgi:hypothetical protein
LNAALAAWHVITILSIIHPNFQPIFLPDSISSDKSPFDIGVLIDAVLAEPSYFGATRSEHAQTRQENYHDPIQYLREGRSLGNTYLQSFAKHGIEQFDYTGFIYRMDGENRVPTLQEHYVDAQDGTPLPIWRPMVFFLISRWS